MFWCEILVWHNVQNRISLLNAPQTKSLSCIQRSLYCTLLKLTICPLTKTISSFSKTGMVLPLYKARGHLSVHFFAKKLFCTLIYVKHNGTRDVIRSSYLRASKCDEECKRVVDLTNHACTS